AMIPSLFAILATFLGMRLFGASLNVATILIATTVLGTTENDQIHFFHHLHERDGHPLGDALAHALRVSGHAIVFATLINAAGFLALSVSSFPPLRQFGLVTSAAFILALIADFTPIRCAACAAFITLLSPASWRTSLSFTIRTSTRGRSFSSSARRELIQ